jgi:hypothetical protein
LLRAPQLFLLFVAVLTASAFAQSDYHLTQDINRQVYLNSTFAHGHRHGYEEGFHAGDEDYHFRRQVGFPPKLPRSKGYQSTFGDKKSYLQGFETGFRAGYADSYSGRAFRATASLVAAEAALTTPSSLKESAHEFDLGVAEGYRAGFANADHIADAPGIAQSAAWRCHQDAHGDSYCNGYGTGYAMGREDSRSVTLIQKTQPSTLAKNSR